jgi:hypothetical protein
LRTERLEVVEKVDSLRIQMCVRAFRRGKIDLQLEIAWKAGKSTAWDKGVATSISLIVRSDKAAEPTNGDSDDNRQRNPGGEAEKTD